MNMIQVFNNNLYFFLIVVTVLSLFIGSFLNVVIYRLPQMMERRWSEECRIYLGLKSPADMEQLNLYLPFSHCPQCKKSLKPWHNIPILSYLYLGGKCAYCRAQISIRYPLVEALTAAASLYLALKFGVSLPTLAALLFTWVSICLVFIDLEYHLLPDELTLLLLWLGLGFSLFSVFSNSRDAIIGAMFGYLIFAFVQWLFENLTGKTGMGQGDFKYLAAIGAFLGWQLIPFVIFFASMIGIVFACIQMLIKRSFKSVPLPFGPYLAVAGWIALLWGQELMTYYLNVL